MSIKGFVCVICNKKIEDEFGNDPWPLKDFGKCCDKCNSNKVIPARFELLKELKVGER